MQALSSEQYPSLPDYWVCGRIEPRHVPSYAAVYVIVEQAGVVKYVGQTKNMRQRYKDHAGRTALPTDSIGWIQCDEQELYFVESWFIATLRPWKRLNQKRREAIAMANKSARINVFASPIWKCGMIAEVCRSSGGPLLHTIECSGRIEELSARSVKISGKWWPQSWVRVLLP